MPSAKPSNRFNVSMPSWLRKRAGQHAETRGLTFAAYVRELMRADLLAAGVDLAPPKRKGTK